MAQILFLKHHFSLRHCKCLLISLLLVCTLMVLAAFRFSPELVKSPAANSRDHPRVLNSVSHDFFNGEQAPKESEQTQASPGVQFLPRTESEPAAVNQADEESIIRGLKTQTTPNLENIVNGDTIFYQKTQVVPDGHRADILPFQTAGIVRPQPPVNTYLSQYGVPATQQEPPVFVPQRRLIHFDLKGAPPKIEYLKQLIPIIAKLGGTGLLLEYEDMFPYEEDLKPVAATNHYSKVEIESLLKVAREHHLEIIPLVQTFGHLEYVLKFPQFSHLRENPGVPQALCPSRNDSFVIVQKLIDQIMSLHKDIKFLHIGCDEVFHMAECSLCSLKPKDSLFLSHVHRVATYVQNKYRVKPIIWDDMLRHITASELNDYKLGELVEPMVWVYAEDIYRFAGSYVFDRYAQVFPSFWVSSSFKGAFGETLVVPDVSRHLENNMNWLEVGRAESPKFKEGLRGLAITGWQRYDHFSNLCELLPAGVPSLAFNLLATSKGYYNQSLATQLSNALSCLKSPRYEKLPDLRNSRNDKFLHDRMAMCSFPGAAFFKLTGRFLRLEKEVEDYYLLTTKKKGWMTEYSMRHNFSSPARVDELMRDLPYMAGSLNSLAKQVMDTLKDVYDVHTVSEWMEQKILPLFQKLDKIQTAAADLRAQKHWPVRPLKLFDKWKDYGLHFDEYYNLNRTQPIVTK